MPADSRIPRLVGSAILTAVLVTLMSGPAQAIAPPKPGVELPPGYTKRLQEDRTAFQFKRAWKPETRRVRENRYLRDRGLPLGVLGLNAASGFRVEGTRRVPVLAGKFSNTGTDPYTDTALQQQLFDGPNPTGTITDYYDEISYGYINLTGTVYGDQAGGLFQVSNTDTYYEGDPGDNGLTGNAKTGEYLKELLDASDPWVDFSQYDNDGPDGIPNSGDDDGYVDFVAFVQPERGGECGTDNIWSHRWVYEGWWGQPYTTNDPAAGGGYIKVSDYTIQPLLSCDNTNIIEIGVFAHEFGHAFGLPDLYDTDTSNGASAGVGRFCLMASGSWGGDGAHPETPSHMSAWCKEQLGWMEPTVICDDQTGISLAAAAQQADAIKIYPHGSVDDEYFLVENRVKTGYDVYLPTSGLAIWHIDNGQSGNADENHKLVDLEEADGLAQMDANINRGDAGDLFPGSTNNQLFSDTTNPNARDYTSAATGFSAGNFSATANPRTLDVTVTACKLAVGDIVVDDSPWGDNSGVLDGYERADLQIALRNDFAEDETGVNGLLTCLTPGVSVLRDSVYFGTVTPGTLNYGGANFEIEATGSLADGAEIQFQLDLAGDGGYVSSSTFSIYAGNYVLLVEDDGISNYSAYYQDAITGAGYTWAHHDIGASGIPGLGLMNGAVAVVWYTGEAYDNTFTPAEQAVVEAYLDGGGRLFVSGQDIGYDLAESGSAADQAFYSDYFHAVYRFDTSNDQTLTGVSGDVIGDGISLTLIMQSSPAKFAWPSVIAGGAAALDVFRYSSPYEGAIRYDGAHRLVYFAFCYEAINDAATRTLVMQRVLDWFAPSDMIPPSATLDGPTGGETLAACGTRTVTWTASDNMGVTAVDLYYSDDGGASYPNVIATDLPNTGSYDWTGGGLVGSAFRVKLVARDAAGLQAVDASVSNFTIEATDPPSVQVLGPNGGESYGLTALVPVEWTMSDTCAGIDSSRVYVSLNGGGDWSWIGTVLDPDTTFDWNANLALPSDSALVRVETFNAAGLSALDESDAFFHFAEDPPVVSVTFPNGGEIFSGGTQINIEASVTDDVGIDSVCVSYTLNDGGSWTVIDCGALSFPYAWDLPGSASDSCRVKVEAWDTGGNGAFDLSDTTFAIQSATAVGPPGTAGITRPVLLQNHPNPMRSAATTFGFYLPEEMPVQLRVYDLSGRLVATVAQGMLGAGYHEQPWDGRDGSGRAVAEGIYFYELQTPERREVKKLVKLR